MQFITNCCNGNGPRVAPKATEKQQKGTLCNGCLSVAFLLLIGKPTGDALAFNSAPSRRLGAFCELRTQRPSKCGQYGRVQERSAGSPIQSTLQKPLLRDPNRLREFTVENLIRPDLCRVDFETPVFHQKDLFLIMTLLRREFHFHRFSPFSTKFFTRFSPFFTSISTLSFHRFSP